MISYFFFYSLTHRNTLQRDVKPQMCFSFWLHWCISGILITSLHSKRIQNAFIKIEFNHSTFTTVFQNQGCDRNSTSSQQFWSFIIFFKQRKISHLVACLNRSRLRYRIGNIGRHCFSHSCLHVTTTRTGYTNKAFINLNLTSINALCDS